MNHPMDYLKIAVITWAAVFVFNKVLKAANLSQFAATRTAQTTP
jgi:hypothetical protein